MGAIEGHRTSDCTGGRLGIESKKARRRGVKGKRSARLSGRAEQETQASIKTVSTTASCRNRATQNVGEILANRDEKEQTFKTDEKPGGGVRTNDKTRSVG